MKKIYTVIVMLGCLGGSLYTMEEGAPAVSAGESELIEAVRRYDVDALGALLASIARVRETYGDMFTSFSDGNVFFSFNYDVEGVVDRAKFQELKALLLSELRRRAQDLALCCMRRKVSHDETGEILYQFCPEVIPELLRSRIECRKNRESSEAVEQARRNFEAQAQKEIDRIGNVIADMQDEPGRIRKAKTTSSSADTNKLINDRLEDLQREKLNISKVSLQIFQVTGNGPPFASWRSQMVKLRRAVRSLEGGLERHYDEEAEPADGPTAPHHS